MVNKLILVGNVGKDPEVTNTETTKIARFSLATSETFKDKSGKKKTESVWHNIVIFGKLAGVVEQWVKKGNQLYLEGKQVNRSFEKDDKKYYVSEVIVNTLKMLGGKSEKQEIKEPDIEMGDESYDLPF